MTRAAAVAAIAVLVLGACTGDDADDATGDAEDISTTTVSPADGTTTTNAAPPPGVTSTSAVTNTTTDVDDTMLDVDDTTTTVDPDDGVSLGPLGSTQVDITTDDGSVQIGSGTIPELAADVPVPDDLEVQLASASGDSAGFSGRTARNPAELADFYRTELPAAGFEIVDDQTLGSSIFIVFVRDGETGQVAVSETPGEDGATIIVAFGAA